MSAHTATRERRPAHDHRDCRHRLLRDRHAHRARDPAALPGSARRAGPGPAPAVATHRLRRPRCEPVRGGRGGRLARGRRRGEPVGHRSTHPDHLHRLGVGLGLHERGRHLHLPGRRHRPGPHRRPEPGRDVRQPRRRHDLAAGGGLRHRRRGERLGPDRPPGGLAGDRHGPPPRPGPPGDRGDRRHGLRGPLHLGAGGSAAAGLHGPGRRAAHRVGRRRRPGGLPQAARPRPVAHLPHRHPAVRDRLLPGGGRPPGDLPHRGLGGRAGVLLRRMAAAGPAPGGPVQPPVHRAHRAAVHPQGGHAPSGAR